MAAVKPEGIADPKERLAHHINAYNALSMFNVIDLGIPQTNVGLGQRYRFFIGRKHVIGGERISLYDYENLVIRPIGESRVHWALNCSAVSCPKLPQKPFTGADLEQELERESRLFFAQERNLRVDASNRTVYLSEIFQFFPEDFVPREAANFIAYAKRFVSSEVAASLDESYQIRFIPYDWTIANWRR
ncbi:MAG: DUF547 domain-containing protein [Brachymonas sp.]|nr:DUF547 domain-containing protein [Brachymonas sp.]